MITKECCKGIIAFLPTAFTPDGGIDEQRNRSNVRKLVEKGADCIQSTGSAGEFWALSIAQHEQMCRIVAEETRGRAYVIAGCGALSTREAIERARIAQDHGFHGAIFVTPFYFPPRAPEIVRFFDEISKACPDIGLVHYNTASAKVLLGGEDYRELSRNQNVIGSKQPGAFGMQKWYEIQDAAPDMVHFGTDDILVPLMMQGGQGIDSIIIDMRPDVTLRAMDLCKKGQWEQAAKLQAFIWRLSAMTHCLPYLEAKYADNSLDKASVHVAGFLDVGDPVSPYTPLAPEDMELLREQFRKFDAMLAGAGI